VPDKYEAIKESVRKSHPRWSDQQVETLAAKIFNATRKKGEKPVTGHGD